MKKNDVRRKSKMLTRKKISYFDNSVINYKINKF